MCSTEERIFEYPFSKTWVWAGLVLAGIALVFAIFLLKDEGCVEIFGLLVHPLLLYFAFTLAFALAVFVLKFYVYSAKNEVAENYALEGRKERSKRLRKLKLSFILVLCLTIFALTLPILFLMFLGPLWTFIFISGYIPAVTLSEVILYIYSRRSSRRLNS